MEGKRIKCVASRAEKRSRELNLRTLAELSPRKLFPWLKTPINSLMRNAFYISKIDENIIARYIN